MYSLSKFALSNPLKTKLVLYRCCTSLCTQHHSEYEKKSEISTIVQTFYPETLHDRGKCQCLVDNSIIQLIKRMRQHDESLKPYAFHSHNVRKTESSDKQLSRSDDCSHAFRANDTYPQVSVEQFLWQYYQDLKMSKKWNETSEKSADRVPVNSQENRKENMKYSKAIFTGRQLDLLFGLEEGDSKKSSDTLSELTEQLQDYLTTASRNLSGLVSQSGIGNISQQPSVDPAYSQICDRNVNRTHSVFSSDTRGSHIGTISENQRLSNPLAPNHTVFCTGDNTSSGRSRSSEQNSTDSHLPTIDQLQQAQDFLVEELPRLILKPASYHMFAKNVVLENNIAKTPYVTKPAIQWYMMQMYKLKFYVNWRYVNCGLTVLNSSTHIHDGTVKLRWQFYGLPQMKILKFWLFVPWKYNQSRKSEGEYIDGISTFSINKDGLVYRHRVDQVMQDEDKAVNTNRSFVDKLRKLVPNVGGATV